MTSEARELMEYMSELSEAGYYAGWMQNLEFDLWDAVVNGPRKYGHLDITAEQIAKLQELSEAAGGWIVFDDAHEEIFVPMEKWLRIYAANQGKVSNP